MPDNCSIVFESNLIIDVLKLDKQTDLTYDEALNKLEKMDSNSVLFNSFDSIMSRATVAAKYFNPYSVGSGANYAIYRKVPNQTYNNFVCDLTGGDYEVDDFNLVNHQKYHYLVAVAVRDDFGDYSYTFFENVDEDGNPIYLNAEWPYWSITDVEFSEQENIYLQSGNVWKLAYNMESGNYAYNTSVTNWDTLGKYGKYSIGQKNYDSSTMSCLLGDITEYIVNNNGNLKTVCDYTEKGDILKKYIYIDGQLVENPDATDMTKIPYSRDVEKMQAWREFITNGKLKLIKDYKGNSWIAQVINSSASNNLQSNLQQTTITFDWQEADSTITNQIIHLGE